MTPAPRGSGALHVVLPGGVDSLAAPSGGNRYDRRACQELAALGWRVVEHPVDGDWPRPDAAQVARLAATLAAVPDGALTLLDGLVACAAPEVVGPAAARLRLAVLVHLPLVDEAGDTDLDARERATLRAVAAVVATSEGAARRLAELHGLRDVRVAAPGVDPAPLSPGTDAGSHLLCVAAVTPRKAQDLLVAALGAVSGLDWTCEFVGALDRDPAYAARVVAAAGELGGRVTFTGPLAGAELDAHYAGADLLVLPSRAETYGMVVTEALARGVPVLATEVGGVPEALGWARPHGAVAPVAAAPPDPATGPEPASGTDRAPADAAERQRACAADQELARAAELERARAADREGAGAADRDRAGIPERAGAADPERAPDAELELARAAEVERAGAAYPERAGTAYPERAGTAYPERARAADRERAGTAELVRPGMLVPPGDPAALADALRRWLTQPDLRANLRAAARSRRSTLDGWDATARALSTVLGEL